MNANRIVAISLLVLFVTRSAQAVVTQAPYNINSVGHYGYQPSPEGPGIPGGAPNNYQLNFGLSGTFTFELDTAGPTARLLDLNLVLTGNEAIQAAPGDFHPVTADRVEAWLASQTFVQDLIGGMLHFESSSVPGLKLGAGPGRGLGVSGGFNHTPADGTAMQFHFGAIRVPEPASAALLALYAAVLLRRRR